MADSARKKGLGRGLSALLGDDRPDIEGRRAAPGEVRSELPLAYLERNPDQPRRIFDEDALGELAASIKEQGLLQPILVRKLAERKYQIIAGERRWRASQMIGLHHVPVIIREVQDDKVLELAVIENIQRENLSPVEEGKAYQRLIKEFGYKQDEAAQVVGKSRSHVANLMRLLDLPAAVQKWVDEKKLTMGHARALVGLDNALELAKKIVGDGLSVRQTEDLVKAVKPGSARANRKPASSSKPGKDADTIALEKDLSAATGSRVAIDHKADGSGTISLHYSDLDKLDSLCALLGVCGVE